MPVISTPDELRQPRVTAEKISDIGKMLLAEASKPSRGDKRRHEAAQDTEVQGVPRQDQRQQRRQTVQLEATGSPPDAMPFNIKWLGVALRELKDFRHQKCYAYP